MDKKPRLGSDPLEWIRDNLKEFFNTPEAKWGETYPEKGEKIISERKG